MTKKGRETMMERMKKDDRNKGKGWSRGQKG